MAELIKGEYNSTPPTATTEFQETPLQQDIRGNLMNSLGTAIDRNNDSITTYEKAGTPVNLSASGQILGGPGKIIGFYVNSTSGGSIRFSDALTATTPYTGAATIPPAVGYYAYPAVFTIGAYVTIATAAIDATFFVILD